MSKKPRSKKWPKRATADRDQVDDLFPGDARYNLGIATGRGTIVLDVDPCHGGSDSLARLEAEHGPLPETAVARSGTGGLHYYFRVEPVTPIGNAVGIWPGLDIRGDGGLIVAPPSVHPDTRRPYEWISHPRKGMAPPPPWLLEALQARSAARRGNLDKTPEPEHKGRQKAARGLQDHATRQHQQAHHALVVTRTPKPEVVAPAPATHRPMPWRAGDPTEVLAEMVARFPVPGIGHRHDLMCRAVGSLVGRGYADHLIIPVMMDWWEHFHGQGEVRTDREGMEAELIACLNSTRSNECFRPAHGESYHEAACASIQLDDAQRRLLKAPIGTLTPIATPQADPPGAKGAGGADSRIAPEDHSPQAPGPGLPPIHCKRVTVMRSTRNRLCDSRAEEQFVEVLLVVAIYQRDQQDEATIRVTHDQIRRIAAARFDLPMPVWDNRQIQRLKDKYITRPGRAATVFELMREVRKGERKLGEKVGVPSEYEPTGILLFLDPIALAASPEVNHTNPPSLGRSDALGEEEHRDVPIESTPSHAA
jgi:hypothetical protein